MQQTKNMKDYLNRVIRSIVQTAHEEGLILWVNGNPIFPVDDEAPEVEFDFDIEEDDLTED